MALHPLAERFASVVGEYDRGRPDYPLAAAGALAAELRLIPGAPVLDLGAGTGKLSLTLLAVGLDVLAVEPLPELRAVLAHSIGEERALEGVAEQIPLGDAAVDAVTVGDAFHWFDQPRAIQEIARVLRPGGGLAILSKLPDWTGASWAHELGQLLAGLRPEHPHFDGPPWQQAVRSAGGWSEPWEVRVSRPQAVTPEKIVDHLASMSWIAAMPDEARAATLDRARSIMHAGQTPAEFPVQVVIGLTTRV